MTINYRDFQDQRDLFTNFRAYKGLESRALTQNVGFQFSASLDARKAYWLKADGGTVYYRLDGTAPTVLPADGSSSCGIPIMDGESWPVMSPSVDQSGALQVITSGSSVTLTLFENSDAKF